nr:unnamed protein product [Hydra vulgaris]
MNFFGEKKKCPYFTWGCADEFTYRLQKSLYCGKENDFCDSSSLPLTDVAVSMVLDISTCPRRKLTHRYASSLTRQLVISPCALMMGILYTEKLRQSNPCYLVRVSSADLYVVAMMVASKFLIDEGEDDEVLNDEWAEAAGLGVSTVNKLERDFLDAMNWKVYVSPSEFLSFCDKVESKIALKCGLKRGWFSYTDLSHLLLASKHQKVLTEILHNTIKVIGSCVFMYSISISLLAISMTYVISNKNRTCCNLSETSENLSNKFNESRIESLQTQGSISLPLSKIYVSKELSFFPLNKKPSALCTYSKHLQCNFQVSIVYGHQQHRNITVYNLESFSSIQHNKFEKVYNYNDNYLGKDCTTVTGSIQTFLSKIQKFQNQFQYHLKREHLLNYELNIPKWLTIMM